MTTYPFSLDERLKAILPAADADGLRRVDVKCHGHWDGILVIDADGRCIGVFADRKVRQAPLPFSPDEITDIRPACLGNRFLANIPETFLWWLPYLYVIVMAPLLLVIASKWLPWVAVGGLLLAPLSAWPILAFPRQWYCLTGLPLLASIITEAILFVRVLLR